MENDAELIQEYNRSKAEEAAYYVIQGYSREDAIKRVNDLEERRNDPDEYIDCGDQIIYHDSELNEPKIISSPQLEAITKELLEKFD